MIVISSPGDRHLANYLGRSFSKIITAIIGLLVCVPVFWTPPDRRTLIRHPVTSEWKQRYPSDPSSTSSSVGSSYVSWVAAPSVVETGGLLEVAVTTPTTAAARMCAALTRRWRRSRQQSGRQYADSLEWEYARRHRRFITKSTACVLCSQPFSLFSSAISYIGLFANKPARTITL